MRTTRVTQIQVRVDCNGCVQKIRKALNGIPGIHDIHVDFRKHKLTITGWADPENIVKAIKKTRKNATICTNTEPSQPAEPKPKGNAPAPHATQLLPPAQASPKGEPPPEATTSTTHTENNASRQWQSYPGRKDAREVRVIHHHLPNYVNRLGTCHSYVGHLERYHNSPIFVQEPPQPVYVTHSYNNTYMPSHYVTECEYVRSPPRHTRYNHTEQHYGGDYFNDNGGNGIASMFSDDNPNACTIV